LRGPGELSTGQSDLAGCSFWRAEHIRRQNKNRILRLLDFAFLVAELIGNSNKGSCD
jgi:hypothetical protein